MTNNSGIHHLALIAAPHQLYLYCVFTETTLLLLTCFWACCIVKEDIKCVSCLWKCSVLCPRGDNIMLCRIHVIAYWFSFCQQSYKFPPSWTLSGSGHWRLMQSATVVMWTGHTATTCTSALHLLYALFCSFSHWTFKHFCFCCFDFYECILYILQL